MNGASGVILLCEDRVRGPIVTNWLEEFEELKKLENNGHVASSQELGSDYRASRYKSSSLTPGATVKTPDRKDYVPFLLKYLIALLM